MSGLTINEQLDPIIVFTWGETISDEDWERFQQYVHRRMQQGQPLLQVNDHRRGGIPDAKQRHQAAQVWNKSKRDADRVTIGVAFVSESRMLRGAIFAVKMLAKLDHPFEVFKTVEEAVIWGRRLAATWQPPKP